MLLLYEKLTIDISHILYDLPSEIHVKGKGIIKVK